MTGSGPYLYVVEGERWHKVHTPFAQRRYIRTDRRGNLWVVPSEGLWTSVDGDQWQRVPLQRPSLAIQYLWIDAVDVVWLKFYNDNTLYSWQHDQLLPLDLPKKVHDLTRLRGVVRDRAGRVWVGSGERGLWSYEDGMWRQVPEARDLTELGLQSGMIVDLCCDVRGHMWTITPTLHCGINDEWRALLIRTSPSTELPMSFLRTTISFRCFHLDHRECLWIGASDGTIAWIDTTAAFEEVPPPPFDGMVEQAPAPVTLLRQEVQWS